MSLVLGLEHSCPRPREGLSSKRLSLASAFFCVLGLGLEPCVLDSISGKHSGKDNFIVFKNLLEGNLSNGRLVLRWKKLVNAKDNCHE